MPAPRNTLQPSPDKWDAFYCRLSRDDDNEGDSNSIQHQKQILERYARDHGIKQYRYYVDDGNSGTNFNRPGFKEMLADIEAGHVGAVIVKDMSRFGRNYLEVGMYTEIRFPEMGVRFIAINDGVDSDNQAENDFTPFRNIMNEWYAKDTSKKIRAVMHAKGMSGGRLTSLIPYGYVKGEDGKLIKDEETAPVVQMIFQLCAEGNGPGKIARILKEREVKTPRTIDFLRTGRTDGYDPTCPCGWSSPTVVRILQHKEYLGHTVNFKTLQKTMKSKRVKNAEDKQIVFENTHEAIISQELWDVVQRIREQRRRPTKSGKIALFSGLLFCADCGSKLGFHSATSHGYVTDNYICNRYRNSRGVIVCSSHYIRESVLETLVLENLRSVMAYAHDHEGEFIQRVMDNTLAEQMKQQTVSKRQLEQQARRIAEIDAIIQRLYEDVVKGTLTDERFAKMSAAYEQEQKALELSAAELRQAVETCENQKVNVKSFLKLVKSYTEPEQLTPEILRMFVEKIIIHEADKSSGHRIQQIDIHYNFVGQFDMSVEKVRSRRKPREQITAQVG